jgi:23S rRNA (pseudouridine1915-N3)-methyltransferase
MLEGERLLGAASKADHIVALDERGAGWTTRNLADRLTGWSTHGSSVALLVGGPDGLAPECLSAARERWSLSPLTLPHGLVRLFIAEAVYRAWSLNRGHPYHRA